MQRRSIQIATVFLFCLGMILPLRAGTDRIPFSEEYWDLGDAQITEYLGRRALTGNAVLKNTSFANGILEVDICVPDVRRRAYPGLYFRVREDTLNGEHLYIRPHRAPIYADALQYAPFCNGESCWQFCNGPGYTAPVNIPADRWNHLRIEVTGHQARVFWNDAGEPDLLVTDLRRDLGAGGVILSRGPGDSPVYFSNFRMTQADDPAFGEPPSVETPEGTIVDWEISRSYPAGQMRVADMTYPRFFVIGSAGWEKVRSEPSGLVNVSKIRIRGGEPGLVFARTAFRSDRKQDIRLDFGYSDEIMIFLNGKPVFHGISHYTSRDPAFLGIVGYHDDVRLTLEKGRNEIFFAVKEWFGGWGFMARASLPLEPALTDHARLEKRWEVSSGLTTPESVVHDPERGVLYVTNYNPRFKPDADESEYAGYISRLDLRGNLLEEKWASPLHSPAGMAIRGNRLYTLERRALAEIDLDTGEILARHPIPDCQFPNDLAIDENGNVYISDTAPADWTKGKILKFSGGAFEVWLDGYDTWRPNAMYVHDNRLLFGGAAGDPFIKAVDLNTRRIDRIASLGAGTIDGFRVDENGNTLVSHWEGQIYSVAPSGEITELLNATGNLNTADFEYIPQERLLIVPTFFFGKVIAFKLGE